MGVVVKLFSPAPVMMCALFVTAVDVGSALSTAITQDAAQDSSAPRSQAVGRFSFTDMQGNPAEGWLATRESDWAGDES